MQEHNKKRTIQLAPFHAVAFWFEEKSRDFAQTNEQTEVPTGPST
jgi:hypothetical protein